MAPNEQRIKTIFKVCFELLEKYKNGISDTDWKDIHTYHEGKLTDDPLAVAIHTACIEELVRQYEAGTSWGR